MAEKNSNGSVQEEPVFVTATRSFGEGLGAAIEIVETKLAKSGLDLQYEHPTPKVNHVDTRVLFLPGLVRLIVSASIGSSVGKVNSIGTKASKDALVPGNIIALYHQRKNRFLRIHDQMLDLEGDTRSSCNDLPLEWGSERFLVVDAGHGCIALYSPCHRVFLGCTNKNFDVSGYPIVNLDDKPRAHQMFRVKDAEAIDQIKLHCDIEDGVAGLNGCVHFTVVQIHGFH